MVGEGLRCPMCSGGAANQAVLDMMIWDLITERGLSEEAESALRAVWTAGGMLVGAEPIFDEIYRWDIEGGPALARMYAALRDAMSELTIKLIGTGVSVIRQGREGWRLTITPGDGAYVAA